MGSREDGICRGIEERNWDRGVNIFKFLSQIYSMIVFANAIATYALARV